VRPAARRTRAPGGPPAAGRRPPAAPLASSRDLSRRACAQIGFNWGAAGVSTSVWKGVLVRDILLKCGVKNPAQGANHVCFLGAEVMPKGRYA